jgi:hypothetical protein
MRTIRTPEKRAAFLQRLAEGESITAAATAIDVGRQTVYEWRADDVDFRQDWDAAIEAGTDRLEDEARRRAIDGSDLLLIFLLRARRPETYNRKQQVALSGDPGSAPISVVAQESNGVRLYLPHNHRDPPETPFVPAPPPHVIEIEGEAEQVTDETENQAEPWQNTKVKAAR